jgi:hypothetical protein
MLAADVFANQWEFLCHRFNKKPDPDEGEEFFKYLRDKLDSDRFLKASQKIWAEYQRFPKPIDFVTEAPPALMLPTPEGGGRDPYFRPVQRVMRGSKSHRAWSQMLARRAVPVPSDSGSPFFFPTATTEIVDSESECGLYFVDCPTLRSLGPRGNA